MTFTEKKTTFSDDIDAALAAEEAAAIEEQARFEKWCEAGIKEDVRKALSEDGTLEDVYESIRDAWRILDEMGTDGARAVAARKQLERLVSTHIDIRLWRDLATGKNVHLSDAAQYGGDAPKTKEGGKRQNDYGAVHSKQDAPSQFLKRQAGEVVKQALRIAELRKELAAAEEKKAAVEAGARDFAMTCLLTQMRKAVTPMFAVGPAWTILRAIAGSSGKEFGPVERATDTQRIMVILHALCEYEPFEQDLKRAIHSVCMKHWDVARERRRPFSEFDFPYDYEFVLDHLGLPKTDSFVSYDD